MGTLTQTALPFKVEATEELLTANAGLALFGEFVRGQGLHRWIEQEMPRPGSGRGYEAGAYVSPLALMLAGGGRSLEDMRTLKADTALATLLKLDILPSTDALGDWLRRTGAGTTGWCDGTAHIPQRDEARLEFAKSTPTKCARSSFAASVDGQVSAQPVSCARMPEKSR